MRRTIGALVLGVTACSTLLMTASARDEQVIKGGIEGKIKAVDADMNKLTITTAQGRDRTFTITDDTTMLGPRGGKVRHRMHDKRFHPGLDIVIVAQGTTATEVHLGFSRGGGPETAGAPAEQPEKATPERAQPKTAAPDRTPTKAAPAPTVRGKAPTKAEEDEDEDNEIPGKIKHFDPSRRILVVTMLNGKDRSFMLSKDVKVEVRGRASARGLEDPSLTTGMPVEIVTDEGGRKVKEVKVVPASDLKGKKAG
jgi:hypothetical protein